MMKKKYQKIIVFMPNWLGDIIMALPVLDNLFQDFSKSKISIVCQEKFSEIFEGISYIDEIITFQKEKKYKTKLIKILSIKKMDLGILLTNSFSTSYIFFRAKIRERIGYKKDFRSFLLTKKMKFPRCVKNIHQVDIYKKLLTLLDVKIFKNHPKLYLKEESFLLAKRRLKNLNVSFDKPIIGINPTAAYGITKCWPEENFKKLTEKLLLKNYQIIFFGDQNSKGAVKNIVRNFTKNVIDLSGKTTISELISIISLLDCFISNDSGPMHIASALNIRVLAIFGSTSPNHTKPFNGSEIVYNNEKCSPCFKKTCKKGLLCMKNIKVDKIYEKIKKMLDQNV